MSYFDSMRETIEDQLSKRIDRKRDDVFLRADFADLGGYDQVGRAQPLSLVSRPPVVDRLAGSLELNPTGFLKAFQSGRDLRFI